MIRLLNWLTDWLFRFYLRNDWQKWVVPTICVIPFVFFVAVMVIR